MRFRPSFMALACVAALTAGSVPAQESPDAKPAEPKADAKKESAPEAKQEQTAAAAKASPADSKKAESKPEDQKAAVNTLEDLFAAYGSVAWSASSREALGPDETVLWKETAPPTKPAPAKKPTP